MNADITRNSFAPGRHRAAVVMQQGRVQLDADWNEQAAITRHRHETATGSIIGPTGAPKDVAGGGFAVSVSPDGGDLLLSPGVLYVDGVLCENTPEPVGAAVVDATTLVVDRVVLDELALAAGQWIAVDGGSGPGGPVALSAVNPATRTLSLASPVVGAAAGDRVAVSRVASLAAQPHSRRTWTVGSGPGELGPGRYVAGLDVWLRERTGLDDPSIPEPALNGLDTATRLEVTWRLELFPMGPAGVGDCTTPVAGFPPPPSTGRLAARAVGPSTSADPCVLPDAGGYRGLEHQLYRVEVHRVVGGDVVLKWQRDNATMVSSIDAVGTSFRVDDLGRDPVSGFVESGFVELSDDALVLENRAGDLLKVAGIDRALREITIDTAFSGAHAETAVSRARNDHRPRARRWDGRAVADTAAPAWLQLELGLEVRLEPGTYHEGDHWLIPARTATTADPGTIEWPRADDGSALAVAPVGVAHHHARLALVDVTAGGFTTVLDCRPTFPALTAITADDVSIDPTACGFSTARTVQDAIDELCGRTGGTCTRTAVPGVGWGLVFAGLGGADAAEVCLPIGAFPLDQSVTVTGQGGHLTVHGAGRGSRIDAPGADSAVVFVGWGSVTVRDLAVATGVADERPRPNPVPGLRGALSFERCGHVTVESVHVRTASRARRAVSCLSVYGAGGATPGRHVARVAHCTFEVGDRQVGLLAVDLGRFVATDNVLRVVPGTRVVNDLRDLTDPERRAVGKLLFAELGRGRRAGTTVEVAGVAHTFTTIPQATAFWQAVLPASGFSSVRELTKEADRRIREVVLGRAQDAASRSLADLLRDRIARRRSTVMAQGIVVGGTDAGDVELTSNHVGSAIQGIHVAVSQRSARGSTAQRMDRVLVADNRVSVHVPAEGARARHGIFVGNAASVTVRGNELDFSTMAEFDRITTAGIKVFGFVDRLLNVRENHLEGFPRSIHLIPLLPRGGGQLSQTRLYQVVENVCVQPGTPIAVEGPLSSRVRIEHNRP